MPLLKKQDLEHHQRRPTGRAAARCVDRGQQRIESRPIERRLDPIQKSPDLPVAAYHRVDERSL
jgi:hypothetical protein